MTDRVRHAKTYKGLARAAGASVGLTSPTPETVAESPEARDARDALWAEYDLRLGDEKTYTLKQIKAWLAEQGVASSIPAIHRDRSRVRRRRRAVEIGTRKVREFMEAAKGLDSSDLFQAVLRRIGQTLFETFGEFGSADLEGMTINQWIRAMETAGYLMRSHAKTEIDRARLAEMRKAARAEADRAAASAADGRMTREDVYRIIDKVMKGEAA